jgi:hypothetical protein
LGQTASNSLSECWTVIQKKKKKKKKKEYLLTRTLSFQLKMHELQRKGPHFINIISFQGQEEDDILKNHEKRYIANKYAQK